MMRKTATFSPDRIYRYSLDRIWIPSKPYAAFIGLNPSTADETNDDPTIRREIRYASDWGFGGLVKVNIFGYRSTDPARLKEVDDPVGPQNDEFIQLISAKAGITVCAWGLYGSLYDRDKQVLKLIDDPYCLGLTKGGNPRHPLYLRKDLKPIIYDHR